MIVDRDISSNVLWNQIRWPMDVEGFDRLSCDQEQAHLARMVTLVLEFRREGAAGGFADGAPRTIGSLSFLVSKRRR